MIKSPTSSLAGSSGGNGSPSFTAWQLYSSDAGATIAPIGEIYRDSASPANDDVLGGIDFYGRDSGNAKQIFAEIRAIIRTVTAGSEIGTLMISPVYNGTLRDQFAVDSTFGMMLAPGGAGVRLATISQGAIGSSIRHYWQFVNTNDFQWVSGNSNEVGFTIPYTGGGIVLGVGAIATNATTGHLYISTSVGTPTGVPAAKTGYAAFQYDSTGKKLWVYDGGWIGVVVS